MDILELPRPVINFLRTMSKEMHLYSLCWDIFGGSESVTLTLTWKINCENLDSQENEEKVRQQHYKQITNLIKSDMLTNNPFLPNQTTTANSNGAMSSSLISKLSDELASNKDKDKEKDKDPKSVSVFRKSSQKQTKKETSNPNSSNTTSTNKQQLQHFKLNSFKQQNVDSDKTVPVNKLDKNLSSFYSNNQDRFNDNTNFQQHRSLSSQNRDKNSSRANYPREESSTNIHDYNRMAYRDISPRRNSQYRNCSAESIQKQKYYQQHYQEDSRKHDAPYQQIRNHSANRYSSYNNPIVYDDYNSSNNSQESDSNNQSHFSRKICQPNSCLSKDWRKNPNRSFADCNNSQCLSCQTATSMPQQKPTSKHQKPSLIEHSARKTAKNPQICGKRQGSKYNGDAIENIDDIDEDSVNLPTYKHNQNHHHCNIGNNYNYDSRYDYNYPMRGKSLENIVYDLSNEINEKCTCNSCRNIANQHLKGLNSHVNTHKSHSYRVQTSPVRNQHIHHKEQNRDYQQTEEPDTPPFDNSDNNDEDDSSSNNTEIIKKQVNPFNPHYYNSNPKQSIQMDLSGKLKPEPRGGTHKASVLKSETNKQSQDQKHFYHYQKQQQQSQNISRSNRIITTSSTSASASLASTAVKQIPLFTSNCNSSIPNKQVTQQQQGKLEINSYKPDNSEKVITITNGDSLSPGTLKRNRLSNTISSNDNPWKKRNEVETTTNNKSVTASAGIVNSATTNTSGARPSSSSNCSSSCSNNGKEEETGNKHKEKNKDDEQRHENDDEDDEVDNLSLSEQILSSLNPNGENNGKSTTYIQILHSPLHPVSAASVNNVKNSTVDQTPSANSNDHSYGAANNKVTFAPKLEYI